MDDTTSLTLGLCLIGVGFLLLTGELVLPSHGVLSVLALAAVAFGVALIFKYDTAAGAAAAGGVVVGMPFLLWLLVRLWPSTPLGRRLLLTRSTEDVTLAELPANQALDGLKGKFGRSLSELRPAGVVDFDGRRVDCVTEGMLIEAGMLVRCVEARAGRVVVRLADRPDITEIETGIFN
jgi:membrane-bound serine protease (ClpP class)